LTEIPEHLLKRSRERRAALGLGGDDAGTTPAPSESTTPATTAAAAPAAAAPAAPAAPAGRAAAPAAPAAPKPKPDSPVVAAYKRRRRIPYWAMAALGLLPVWGFMYARAVTAQPVEAAGPLAVGDDTYGGCASCHGATGGGGSGRQFSDGEVLLTFPNIEDQLRFVYWGTDAYNGAGIENYRDPEREGGAHTTGSFGVMPQQGQDAGGGLTDAEILGVVCHERYALGGADPTGAEYAEEYETWCSEESEIFHALEDGSATLATLHEMELGEVEIIPIGDAPAEGSPAG
jgi:hypothetical protein